MGSINNLKSKEKKQLLQAIEKQWGGYPEVLKEEVLIKTGKDRIYLVNRDVDRISFENIRINSAGLYIAEQKGELRLSIEGSQLIGPKATKNVIEIDDEQRKLWFTGQDIPLEGESKGFLILKHGKDYIGSGKHKEGKIHNYVPKNRRLLETH